MNRLFVVCMIAMLILTNCRKYDNDNLLKSFKVTELKISSDSIQVNPYGFTPLSALVSFNTTQEGKTFIRVHGKHGAFRDVTHLFNDFGTVHSVPVIGLYADTTNTVDIRIINATGDTVEAGSVTIVTQALPTNMPASIVANSFDENKVAPGIYLVSSLTSYKNTDNQPFSIPYMLDDYGDIRWVLNYATDAELATLFYNDGIARLKNGNFYFGDESTDKIYEVDVLGKIINTWPVSGYLFHHEVHEEENGNFLLTATKPGSTFTDGSSTVGDFVVEIDRNSKQVSNVWDLKESLNEYRLVWIPDENSDWFHGNAVLDDTTDNTIIVSGRTQGVVKLDRSNHIKWILAPHKDWGTNRRGEDLNKYLLTPLDASGNVISDTTVAYGNTTTPDFEWNCYQHCPLKLPDGNLMLFDNGTNRTLDPVDGNLAFNGGPGKYSRAAEYKIDTMNMTVQQVWQYGKERDVECYSSIVSSVQFLPNSNHVVFAPGFNVQNAQGKGGKVVELDYDTKQVVNEISISSPNGWSAHRVKKISVYPDNL